MHVLQETPEESFEEWANLHNKVYASDVERAERLTVWLDNLAYIQSFNAKKASHWVRPNPSICPRFATDGSLQNVRLSPAATVCPQAARHAQHAQHTCICKSNVRSSTSTVPCTRMRWLREVQQKE